MPGRQKQWRRARLQLPSEFVIDGVFVTAGFARIINTPTQRDTEGGDDTFVRRSTVTDTNFTVFSDSLCKIVLPSSPEKHAIVLFLCIFLHRDIAVLFRRLLIYLISRRRRLATVIADIWAWSYFVIVVCYDRSKMAGFSRTKRIQMEIATPKIKICGKIMRQMEIKENWRARKFVVEAKMATLWIQSQIEDYSFSIVDSESLLIYSTQMELVSTTK